METEVRITTFYGDRSKDHPPSKLCMGTEVRITHLLDYGDKSEDHPPSKLGIQK